MPPHLDPFSGLCANQDDCWSGEQPKVSPSPVKLNPTYQRHLAQYPPDLAGYRENFSLFKKHRNTIRLCFYFNPRCGIWGLVKLSAALDYGFPRSLLLHDFASCRWFLRLCDYGILGTFFRGYIKARAPRRVVGWLLLVTVC